MADMKRFGRVGVLMGGPSSERDISLKSGKGVLEALTSLGMDAVGIDITTADEGRNTGLIRASAIQCAFLALHGSFGEDGQVQRLLESLAIPYTGSGPQASGLALDKTASREVFIKAGLAVPDGIVVTAARRSGARDAAARLGLPLVVKPATQGSSIGLSIIDSADSLDAALDAAFAYDASVLIEQYVKGRELTVGILGGSPLAVIEIVPKNRFFDFEAKYKSGQTEYIVPARIPEDAARRAQDIALRAHASLGCAGCSRSDLIYDERGGGMYLLEVNTIPGLTPTSLLPKAATQAGIGFPELCLRLLESAYEKK